MKPTCDSGKIDHPICITKPKPKCLKLILAGIIPICAFEKINKTFVLQ